MTERSNLEERLRATLADVPSAPVDPQRVIAGYRRRRSGRILAATGSLVVVSAAVVGGAHLWLSPPPISPADGTSSTQEQSPTQDPDDAASTAEGPIGELPSPSDDIICEEPAERSVSDNPDVIIDPLASGPLQEFIEPLEGTITQAIDYLDCDGNSLPINDSYSIHFASDDTHIAFSAITATPELWAYDLEDLPQTPTNQTETTIDGYPAIEAGDSFGFALFDESQALRVQVSAWVGDVDEGVEPPQERREWILDELLPRILDRSLAP